MSIIMKMISSEGSTNLVVEVLKDPLPAANIPLN
jgi:hypothetical protein